MLIFEIDKFLNSKREFKDIYNNRNNDWKIMFDSAHGSTTHYRYTKMINNGKKWYALTEMYGRLHFSSTKKCNNKIHQWLIDVRVLSKITIEKKIRSSYRNMANVRTEYSSQISIKPKRARKFEKMRQPNLRLINSDYSENAKNFPRNIIWIDIANSRHA